MKNTIAVSSSFNPKLAFWDFEKQIEANWKNTKYLLLRKIERNMVGSRRWIGRNKRQIWYWKYPSRPQQPAFSKSPSQINVRRKFLSNSNPFTDKRIIVSGFQQIHNYIMQLYQCRGRSNSKVKTSFQKTTFLSENYTFKRIIQSLCGLFKWHGHIWTCKREVWDASL